MKSESVDVQCVALVVFVFVGGWRVREEEEKEEEIIAVDCGERERAGGRRREEDREGENEKRTEVSRINQSKIEMN